jgi:hypothetical protein
MVKGGILHLEDMQGNLIARQPIGPCDDAEALARKLLHEKSGRTGFYAPIYHKKRAAAFHPS